jgi:hypothetical protein
MNEFKLNQIKEAVEKTFSKLEGELENDKDLLRDIEKISILYDRVTALCEDNQELATKIIEYVLKKRQIETMGEFNYMLNEINKRE